MYCRPNTDAHKFTRKPRPVVVCTILIAYSIPFSRTICRFSLFVVPVRSDGNGQDGFDGRVSFTFRVRLVPDVCYRLYILSKTPPNVRVRLRLFVVPRTGSVGETLSASLSYATKTSVSVPSYLFYQHVVCARPRNNSLRSFGF